MTPTRPTSSERVRRRLDHPVIDADGHFLEFQPALGKYLREEGVAPEELLAGGVASGVGTFGYTDLSEEERLRKRATRTPWWAAPAGNTLDLATATLPGLLYERLDELGIDFAVMYGSVGIVYPLILDDKKRNAACRAVNRYAADVFEGYADRMAPAAVVPLQTPAEAIEHLEHAAELGLKAVMISGYAERPVEDPAGGAHNVWWDTLGVDSIHDYDPFWQRCVDLGISLGCHGGSMGMGLRRSTSRYMFNHIGHFSAVGEAFAKSLFFGGVTKRFPKLRVALLEGGVHWAVGLYADLLSRWEKRNIQAVQTYDPANVDGKLFRELIEKYGGPLRDAEMEGAFSTSRWADDGGVDDFEGLGIAGPEDIRDLFSPSFFFGCEADDPMTPTAFDTDRIPLGAKISAMFSSDIGHWDVPEMTEVLEEAHENVDKGWLDKEQFRDFVFGNVARFYTDSNPDFFRGTVVEAAVDAEVGNG